MSHIRHYWVLAWVTGPLTLPESIADVPVQRVAKTGKSSNFWLLSSSFFHSVTVSQASTMTAEAITTIQMPKSSINHRVVHSLLIVIVELELFFSNSQALQCWMLSARHHFARIIETTPLEAQLSTCSENYWAYRVKDQRRTATAKVGYIIWRKT